MNQKTSDIKAKVLLFDIETAPNLSYTWGKWEQNVIEFKEQGYMLCFAYKWLGEKTVHVKSLPDYDTYKDSPHDDFWLVQDLHALFEEADVIIAHNGDQFDIKKANTRFMVHHLSPPSHYKTIDTLKIARRVGKFESNKLDDLGKDLHIGRKVKHPGFEMWLGCMSGDKSAWEHMTKYNKQDVALLEELYLALRPWVTTHPNLSHEPVHGEKPPCPKCGTAKPLFHRYQYNMNSVKRLWKCRGCFGYYASAYPRSLWSETVQKKMLH
jgi:uncharacterized protein YprB with RNaseH-like and TPR domain